ncbi:MAG: radical SAM protein [Nitrososphaerales archaeon]|jgi:uncharacterized radical SAM superfamily Fe-S cluster-containing enzyme
MTLETTVPKAKAESQKPISHSPSLTTSLCPSCRTVIPAKVYYSDGKVLMEKNCSKHGKTVSLISSDSKLYEESFSYNIPGKLHLIKNFLSQYTGNCPLDCGICSEHLQHTCLAMIETTNRCNLNCPVCYMNANEGPEKIPSLNEIKGMLELLLKAEVSPPAINITGGEATTRKDLHEIISLAHSMGFNDITLSTNGIVVSKKPELLADLAAAGLTEVAISLDGLNDDIFLKTRGIPMFDTKVKAIDASINAGLSVTVSATLVPGINVDQIGGIIEFAKKRHLDGVNFAPIAFVGRYPKEFLNYTQRITIPDVLKEIETQTKGEISVADFIPVPCPDNRCSTMTYAFNDGKHLFPITDYIDIKAYLDVYGDKVTCGPDGCDWISQAIDKLWSMSAIPGSERVMKNIGALSPKIRPANDVMTIQVHAFQDVWTFDTQRIKKCCIHVADGDKLIPFCAYNNLYRGKHLPTL